MADSPNILNYYAQLKTAFLHPKGKKATHFLLEKLNINSDEKILEFGCGTGATLVHFASIHKSARFYGVEHNHFMHKSCSDRVSSSNLNNVHLYRNQESTKIDFEDNFFDAVYVESVLAIQEENDIELVIKELNRVLKPQGKLIINEGIWSDNFSFDEIKKMNAFCKLKFGIIQSTEKYPYISDWKVFLENANFQVQTIHNLNELNSDSFSTRLLSKLDASKEFISIMLNPQLRKLYQYYKKEMNSLSKKGRYLEGYLIVSQKQNSWSK